jgi:hypothetical protein
VLYVCSFSLSRSTTHSSSTTCTLTFPSSRATASRPSAPVCPRPQPAQPPRRNSILTNNRQPRFGIASADSATSRYLCNEQTALIRNSICRLCHLPLFVVICVCLAFARPCPDPNPMLNFPFSRPRHARQLLRRRRTFASNPHT